MKYLLMIAIFAIGCGKDDAEPGEVTVKQEPAVAGEKGEQGENGIDGTDGENTTTEIREELGANLWVDPVTNATWLIGGIGKWVDTSYCSGEFKAANRAELITAGMHGLLEVAEEMGADKLAWTTEEASAVNGYLVNMVNSDYLDMINKNVHHGIYCFKEAE